MAVSTSFSVGAGMPGGGKPVTLEAGDSLRIEFKLGDGPGPFGAIDMDLAEPDHDAGADDDEPPLDDADDADEGAVIAEASAGTETIDTVDAADLAATTDDSKGA